MGEHPEISDVPDLKNGATKPTEKNGEEAASGHLP
jgi:hypothetical protein